MGNSTGHRWAKGNPKRGGRKKGTPNKATTEIQRAAHKLIHDPVGWNRMLLDYRKGKLNSRLAVELLHYAHGVPKHTTVVENPDGSPVTFTLRLDDGERS